MLFENTAAEKLHHVMNKLLEVRTQQKALLNSRPDMLLGDVTSVNMTMLGGGLQANVVPPELSAVFDVRISPNWPVDEFQKFLDSLCAEAGPDVTYEFLQYSNITDSTSLTADNLWWTTFKNVCDKL